MEFALLHFLNQTDSALNAVSASTLFCNLQNDHVVILGIPDYVILYFVLQRKQHPIKSLGNYLHTFRSPYVPLLYTFTNPYPYYAGTMFANNCSIINIMFRPTRINTKTKHPYLKENQAE